MCIQNINLHQKLQLVALNRSQDNKVFIALNTKCATDRQTYKTMYRLDAQKLYEFYPKLSTFYNKEKHLKTFNTKRKKYK